MSDVIGLSGKARAASIPDMVITRLSPLPCVLRFMTVVVILFGCWYTALYPQGATAKDLFESRVFLVFALILTPMCLWVEWTTFRQMLFHQARAVWIEGSRLKFINEWGFMHRVQVLEITDIQELSLDFVYMPKTWWRLPCVDIKLKGGMTGGSILTLYCTDTAKVVLARLMDVLPLPKAS